MTCAFNGRKNSVLMHLEKPIGNLLGQRLREALGVGKGYREMGIFEQ